MYIHHKHELIRILPRNVIIHLNSIMQGGYSYPNNSDGSIKIKHYIEYILVFKLMLEVIQNINTYTITFFMTCGNICKKQ